MSNPHDEHRIGPRAGEPVLGRRVGSGEMGHRQGDTSEPIVEHPHLPRMDDKPRPQGRLPGQGRLMDEHTPARATGAGRGEMAAVPDNLDAPGPGDREYPPQRPAPEPGAAPEPGGYLRLQLRVDDGDLSLVSVNRVAGPLGPPEPVHGGLAYEVSLGRQHLGAGDVPDPGVRRGFAPPDAPERGHSVVNVPSFEFTARIPADRVSTVNLPDLQVAVYRLDSGQVIHPTTERPLREHVGQLAEEVATLRGIHTDRLPEHLRAGIERALG
jgi:hypothetical protein